jgi:hypothetical protein
LSACLLADVGKIQAINELLQDARDIVTFTQRQAVHRAQLAYQQEQHSSRSLELDCATCFASKHRMLGQLLNNKPALRATVAHDDFNGKKTDR